ncbi:MAG: hypothetical protein M3N93_08705 [Acidobacteriota bacterium]|nr:hypothetical protein [Acidobacteriota bacterium]
MSFDKKDVKNGIDKAAARLKTATDNLTAKSQEAGEIAKAKAKDIASKAGDRMIEQGRKLKSAGR